MKKDWILTIALYILLPIVLNVIVIAWNIVLWAIKGNLFEWWYVASLIGFIILHFGLLLIWAKINDK